MKKLGEILEFSAKADGSKRFEKDSTSTTNQCDESEKPRVYPKWLEDLFLLFLITYEILWSDSVPDERSKELRKSVWYNTLKNFNQETIERAAKKIIVRCKTFPPKIGEFHEVCEELRITNRYNTQQITNKPQRDEPSPLLAEYMQKNGTPSKEDVEKVRESWRKRTKQENDYER